jgi:hypothetical protein
MASTETRPSFRLPWTAGTGESGEPAARRADEQNAGPDTLQDEEPPTPETNGVEAELPAAADSEGSSAAPARRATKFMADLSRAMQAAAEHARNETMTRFELEAKAFIDEIHSSTTAEVAELRRRADDDIAAIREWSKAEIAHIREETEARVAARKTGLDAEMEAHGATVDARAARVTTVVAAFEAEMGEFFERLNAEEDPTRIATMAETMPDPPSLSDVIASVTPTPVILPERVRPEPAPAAVPVGEPTRRKAPLAEAEIDFAAAEAEAASFDGDLKALGDEDDDQLRARTAPAATSDPPAAAVAEPEPAPTDATAPAPATATTTTTRVIVAGLVSVASIANFKRSLARIGAVRSIGVASGPDGDFVFTVSHDAGLALSTPIVSMAGFESQVTGESDGEIKVLAHDRDAGG